MPARCQVNGPELHGDVKPVEDAAGRLGSAVDGFFKLSRAVKRVTQPMLGFKSFWSARILIAGIETMHMIRKEQMDCSGASPVSAADQFYSLAV